MTFPVSPRIALSAFALAISSTYSVAAFAEAAAPSVSTVLVTATRTPQAATEALSDHVVLNADDIARSGATSVIDLLKKQRSVEVSRNGGPATTASVFIRGGDSKQTVVLVDGVRIGSSTSGIANWSALPLSLIDRVEIIYGPLATMYGADAIGGVVQVFTKRGDGPARISAGASVGSDKARSGDASIAGSTASGTYAISVARDQDEGFSATKPGNFSFNPDNDGYTRDSASGLFDWNVATGHNVGFLFMHSKMDAEYDAGMSTFEAHGLQKLTNLAFFSSHQVAPSWRVKYQVSRADDKSANYSSSLPSGASFIDTRLTAYSMQNEITAGADLLQVIFERRVEDVTSISTPAIARRRDTRSAAMALTVKRDAHTANASARIDNSDQYGDNVTGGLAYGYRLSPAMRINASAGTSFRAPTFNELYFPNFGVASNRPEHGKNVEAGVTWRSGPSELTAVYYRNKLTDLLVSTSRCPVNTASYPFGCAYNVNSATLSGLTIGERLEIGKLSLTGSLDFQDPRDETTGKQLARRARRHASFAADYDLAALSLGANWQLSGKRFDDVANRTELPGYGLLNLTASYRVAPDWSVFARLNNVTDKQYELARTYNTAGREVFVGVRYGVR